MANISAYTRFEVGHHKEVPPTLVRFRLYRANQGSADALAAARPHHMQVPNADGILAHLGGYHMQSCRSELLDGLQDIIMPIVQYARKTMTSARLALASLLRFLASEGVLRRSATAL